MKFRSFVKLPNYKRFNFEPRYYDAVKEEVANRERIIKGTYKKANKAEFAKHRISDAFNNRQREDRKPVYTQILIVIIIATLLGILFLYLDRMFTS